MDSIKFAFSPSKETVMSVDGVWGGVGPNGKVTASFYVEYVPLPHSVTHSIDNGVLGPETERELDPRLAASVREVVATIVMDADTAKSVGKWLIENAEQYQRLAPEGKKMIEVEKK